MKKLFKILILPIAVITILMGFANVVSAGPVFLSVQFVPDPLFTRPNFLPGDETSGIVTVTNNGEAPQTILTEAINILDSNNFGSLLHIVIKEGSVVLFDDSLADFFTSGEVSLGQISNGTPRTFSYTVSFIDSNDNTYQGKTLGFDVCVGFQGGQIHCGDTVIGGEDGDGGGGSTHGSSGSLISLIIFNEQASNITSVGASESATITWNTNLLSTSQVVYGLASGGPYSLVLTPPNFGYPFYVNEDPMKVINHSMLLTGLIPGETYVYRVISRASPPTVSPEHQFTVPLSTPFLAQAGNNNFTGGNASLGTGGSGNGEVLGAETEIEEIPKAEEEGLGLLATPFASGFGDIFSICTLIALLILLLIYLIWILWLRKKYEKDLIIEEEIKNRFWLFFGGSSLLAVLVCVIFSMYCPLPVFITAFIISACLYIYRKLKVK